MAGYLRGAHLAAAAVVTGRAQRAPWVTLAAPMRKAATAVVERAPSDVGRTLALEGAGKRVVPDSSVHLDAIRGGAALLVFLGHGRNVFLKSGLHDAIAGRTAAVGANRKEAVGAATAQTSIGHQSVIVFFVLSGYFVGGSVLRGFRKGHFRWESYLFQRLTRLWVALVPALLLGLALDLVGMHLIPGPGNLYSGPAGQMDVSADVGTTLNAGVLLGNMFFLQGLVCRVLGTNVSLWSLSYEFWYYIFFPLTMTACLRSKAAGVRVSSGVLLGLAMVFCGWYLCANFLLWLLGAGVAMLPLRLAERFRRAATLAAGAGFALALLLELKYPIVQLKSDFLLGVVFSGFLWCVLHARGATVGSFYRRAAHGLSNMSYTLYLVHMPCFVFLSALLMPEWRPWVLSAGSLTTLAGVYGVVFAVCWGMYWGFERNTDAIRGWAVRALGRQESI